MANQYQHNFDSDRSPLNRAPANTTSPITPGSAGSQPPSFRTNVNRAKTKRWVEAKSYSYDGDDWGDGDEYDEYDEPSAPSNPTGLRQPGQAAVPVQNPASGDNTLLGRRYYGDLSQQGAGGPPTPRSTTNPALSAHPRGRGSFDQGDDKRAFSSGNTAFGAPQQAGLPGQASQMDTGSGQGLGSPRPQPPLQIQTQPRRSVDREPFPHAQYSSEQRGMPYPGQMVPPGRRSRSNDRPSPIESPYRRESPNIPPNAEMSGAATSSREASPGRRFPPRKSSLSQQNTPIIPSSDQVPQERSEAAPTSTTSAEAPMSTDRTTSNPTKPLPFIRPADIYKRMEEEREKERRSQESGRPSLDSAAGKSRDESSPAPQDLRQRSSSDSIGRPPLRKPSFESSDDGDSSRRLKPMLDPVAERKSEYGFENMLKDTPAEASSVQTPKPVSSPEQELPSASSKYSEHPISPFAQPQPDLPSSNHSDSSLGSTLPEVSRVSDFGDDFIPQRSSDRNVSEKALPAAPTSTSTRPGHNPSPQSEATDTSLHHNQSLGFRSIVNQAFDNPDGRDVPMTPSSMGDSVVRSNSDSTSAISPIISRHPSSNVAESRAMAREATPTISEEPAESNSRPTSSGTMKHLPAQTVPDEPSEPLPPAFRPGHRRNLSTPSPDNSPARRPILEAPEQFPKSELGELSSVIPTESRQPEAVTSLDDAPRTPLASRKGPFESPSARQGDSPIPRAESPNKGKVRDLTGKFESQGSPVGSPEKSPETPRPSAPPHLESFRPTLPGGWVSYATTPGASTPQDTTAQLLDQSAIETKDQIDTSQPENEVHEDTDVTPTRIQHERKDKGSASMLEPFANAAAGSALAGAFAAATGKGSDDAKEDAVDRSTDRQDLYDRNVEEATRDHIAPLKPSTTFLAPIARDAISSASSAPPTPPPKDAPRESSDPRMERQHFPPSVPQKDKAGDKFSTPSRPQMLPALSTDTSPHDTESDRLRKEIIRTLTPRTSNAEEEGRPRLDEPDVPEANLLTQPASRDAVESTILPSEYDSYWNETADDDRFANEPPKPKHSEGEEHDRPTPIGTGMRDASPPKDLPSLPQEQAGREEPLPHRPILQQKFSWEQEGDAEMSRDEVRAVLPGHSGAGNAGLSSPHVDSPDTIRAAGQDTFLTSPTRQGDEHPTRELGEVSTPSEAALDADDLQDSGSRAVDHSEHNPTHPGGFPANAAMIADDDHLAATADRDVSPVTPRDSDFGTSDPQRETPILPPGRTSVPTSIEEDTYPQIAESPTDNYNYRDSIGASPVAPRAQSTGEAPNEERPFETSAAINPQSPNQPRILSFREIMSLKSPHERIQAYNSTREQFATMDTRLGNWLSLTGYSLPEHAVLVSSNGLTSAAASFGHKVSPTRSKFPKIGSLGGLGSFQDSSPETSRPVHNRQPSGSALGGGKMTSQHVQAKGKDLLHSAGVFGGKAGGAAKGLFAKGKSRFRNSGGGDKAMNTSRRSSQPLIAEAHQSASSPSSVPAPAGSLAPYNATTDDRPFSFTALDESAQFSLGKRGQDPEKSISDVDEHTAPAETSASSVSKPAESENAASLSDIGRDLQESDPVTRHSSRSTSRVGTKLPPRPSAISSTGKTPASPALDLDLIKAQRATLQQSEIPKIHEPVAGDTKGVVDTPASSKAPSDPIGSPQEVTDRKIEIEPSPDVSLLVSGENRDALEPKQPEESRNNVTPATERPRPQSISPLPSPGLPDSTSGELSPAAVQLRHRSISPLPPNTSEASHIPTPSSLRGSAEVEEDQRALTTPPSLPASVLPPPGEVRHTATPPTSSPAVPTAADSISAKEAEAQSENVLNNRSSEEEANKAPPAYRSSTEEKQERQAKTGCSWARIGEQSLLRHQENVSERSRPFSFASRPDEEILDGSQLLNQQTSSPRILQSDQLEENEESLEDNRPRSYSRPFQDPNIHDHPAFRQGPSEADRALLYSSESRSSEALRGYNPMLNAFPPSQARDGVKTFDPVPYGARYIPTQDREVPPMQNSQYASPGPPRSGTMPPGGSYRPAEPNHDRAIFPRLQTTEYQLPGVGPPSPPQPSRSRSRPTSGLFRARSKSRPRVPADDKSDNFDNSEGKKKRTSIFRTKSKPDSDSTRSRESTLVNASGSRPDLGQQSTPTTPQGANNYAFVNDYKGKEKKQNKLQRSSTSGVTSQDSNKKKGFRLSNLFGRSGTTGRSTKPSPPPSQQPVHRTSTLQTPPTYAGTNHAPQSFPSRQTSLLHQQFASHQQQFASQQHFAGQPPPVGGYYAPSPRMSPPSSDFVGGRRLSEQRVAEAKHGFENQSGFRGPYHGQQYPPTLAPIDTRYAQRNYSQAPNINPLPNRSPLGSGRGLRQESLDHTRDLQRRSRSPRARPRSPNGYPEDQDDADPAHNLGTFRSQNSTPRLGDQEKPWSLSIPEEREEGKQGQHIGLHNNRRQSIPRPEGDQNDPSRYPPPDSAADIMSPVDPAAAHMAPPPPPKIPLSHASSNHSKPSHPSGRQVPLPSGEENPHADVQSQEEYGARVKATSPVELPVPGDDESEEIVMSSTAYPGQEWMPSNWGHWDGD